jgi:hypothetical protein
VLSLQASLPASLVGVDLMRAALNEDTGALTDTAAVKAERQALSHLFAGAFGHGRKPRQPPHSEPELQRGGLLDWTRELSAWDC